MHSEVHKAAKLVYELKMSGNDVAALREFMNMDKASMKLVSLLHTATVAAFDTRHYAIRDKIPLHERHSEK